MKCSMDKNFDDDYPWLGMDTNAGAVRASATVNPARGAWPTCRWNT
jgi:hypothetical protein